MKTRFFPFLVLALIATVLVGCQSPASRFYTLSATAKGTGTNDLHCAVFVGPVTIPAEVDRPQFTLQITPNQVAIDEFDRWAEPLSDAIAHAVAGDLSVLLGTPQVTTSRVGNARPEWQVSINVRRFESVPGKTVVVDALWEVRYASGKTTLSGHTLAREPVAGRSFNALAAAHSRALERVSEDIAAVIRAETGTKP